MRAVTEMRAACRLAANPACYPRLNLLQPRTAVRPCASNALDGIRYRHAMNNFVRALRYCWPHRGRIITSIICALLAAFFWGLMFSAIYPVFKIVRTGQNLQDWIDAEIVATRKKISGDPEKNIEGKEHEENRLE